MSSPRQRALEAAHTILNPEPAGTSTRQDTGGKSRPAAPQSNQPELEAFFALAQLLPPAPVPASLMEARVRAAEQIDSGATAGRGATAAGGDSAASGATGPPGATAGDGAPAGSAAAHARAHGGSLHGSAPARVRSGGRPWVPAIAGAVVTAVVLVAAALVLLPVGAFQAEGVVYLSGTGAARQARGVALHSGEELIIYAEGLSRLEGGYRYVAWNRVGEATTRLGSLVVLGGGRVRLRVRADEKPMQLEITIERSTGTGGPEGPAVLAGFASPRS